jgi:hypothetical protein
MRRVWRYLLLFCFNVHNYQAWRLYLPCLYIGNEVLEPGISERVKIDTAVTLWIHISSISAPGLILRGQFTNIIHIKMYRHIILKQIICLLRKQSHQFKKKIIICSWKKYKIEPMRNKVCFSKSVLIYLRGGRGRMVVGFTTTYAISAYHQWYCEFELRSVQHYMIKFVSDLRQVGGFLRILRFPSPIKLTAMI